MSVLANKLLKIKRELANELKMKDIMFNDE